jgi:hypothetical protein
LNRLRDASLNRENLRGLAFDYWRYCSLFQR